MALRVRGALRTVGEPVPAKLLLEAAQELIDPEQWPLFVERRSFDLSKTILGVRAGSMSCTRRAASASPSDCSLPSRRLWKT